MDRRSATTSLLAAAAATVVAAGGAPARAKPTAGGARRSFVETDDGASLFHLGRPKIAWKAVLGLRPTIEAEQEGLDLSDHGEEGYIYEAKS